ncbi:MAG TPA: DUF2239 family protein [Bryobacteraceae bacterium]|jgi:hypothetical protein|nr:DUF2239 family protein [Bryobacteraceae bacterium]
MNHASSRSYTAFVGTTRIASGDLPSVACKIKAAWNPEGSAPLLIFDDATSRLAEVDLRGTLQDVLTRIAEEIGNEGQSSQPASSDDDTRRPGRPKLGVVAREVTLLPRHWEWLATQPGGASVALRKLVEQARLANQAKDRRRRAQDVTYRFLSAVAGNESYFEEAARALFAGNKEPFERIVDSWPIDIAEHAKKLAADAFETPVAAVDAGQ